MRIRSRTSVIVGLALVASLLISLAIGAWLLSRASAGLTQDQLAAPSTGTPDAGSSQSPAVPAAVVLPNPRLTPGIASSDVTPANTAATICVSGYTSGRRHDDGRTVRPPESYTSALKRQQIAQYGYADTNLADYEEDHLIPLELGGDGYAAGNLWPEPYAGAGAHVKDQLENRLRVLVCDGQLGLRVAQEAIAINWYAAYQRYVSAST